MQIELLVAGVPEPVGHAPARTSTLSPGPARRSSSPSSLVGHRPASRRSGLPPEACGRASAVRPGRDGSSWHLEVLAAVVTVDPDEGEALAAAVLDRVRMLERWHDGAADAERAAGRARRSAAVRRPGSCPRARTPPPAPGPSAASISARSTITLHCFQVASSCILPSIMCTPRPSGIASITFFAKRTSSGSGLNTRLAISICRGCSDQAPDAAHQEGGAELGLAADVVADVAERPVEGEDPGRGAGVDHARRSSSARGPAGRSARGASGSSGSGSSTTR